MEKFLNHEKPARAASPSGSNFSLHLRVGEWIEVKSAEEIMETLAPDQCVDSLPFMPEMLRYCGRRFRVYKSAHKTADTIELFTIRRMKNAVHLQDLRCDGAAHGGCQAGCLLFWKECWLRRVGEPETAAKTVEPFPMPPLEETPCTGLMEGLFSGTCSPTRDGEPKQYRCQATEILNATTGVRRRERWDPRFYVRDLTSGNVKLLDFIRFGALAAMNAFLQHWFNRGYPSVRGLAGENTPTEDLNLKVGELVRVRSKHEIQRTLNRNLRNRGMWFDIEMLPYCGKGNFRVVRRVERIINEKSGQMMTLKNPCIILEGVNCSGNRLARRMFSPRNEPIYWREIWLERVNPQTD